MNLGVTVRMQQYAISKNIRAAIHTVFYVVVVPSSVHVHLAPTMRAQAPLIYV